MKRALKIVGIIFGCILLLIVMAASYVHFTGIPEYEVKAPDLQVEADSARIARGEKLAFMICANCHASDKSNSLSGRFLTDVPKEFGKIYSANITQDRTYGIGEYTDGELAYLLRTGIKKNGMFSPPYMPKFPLLSDEDIHSIIAYLRSDARPVQAVTEEDPPCEPSFLSKFLCQTVFKPLPYPEIPVTAPPMSDTVAYGRYLATGAVDCFSCHSADFKTMDIMVPENSEGFMGGGNTLLNPDGVPVKSANITMDKETGIGTWTEEQFALAVRAGIVPNGPGLSPAMPRFTLLNDDEVHAIWTYLKTVPVISNKVERGPQPE